MKFFREIFEILLENVWNFFGILLLYFCNSFVIFMRYFVTFPPYFVILMQYLEIFSGQFVILPQYFILSHYFKIFPQYFIFKQISCNISAIFGNTCAIFCNISAQDVTNSQNTRNARCVPFPEFSNSMS